MGVVGDMKQYQVVAGISDTLGALLKDAFRKAGFPRVDINHEVPKRDNIRSKPCVTCYQYHLGFATNYRERTQQLVSSEDENGRLVTYYQDSPLYLYAHYLIATFGNTAREEALLVGLAVKTFLEHPIVTGDQLRGECFYPDDKLNIYPKIDGTYEDVLSFWRSLNEEVRPAVFYYTKFRIDSARTSQPMAEVTERQVTVR